MIQDRRKPDAQKFLDFLDELKQAPWLGNQRRPWVDYLFHFTHIQNAVSILKSGFLLSRAETRRQGIGFASSASSQIISKTAPAVKDSVRFYFRPETPTTYHMEGFKPLGQLYEDAHCPVPVYFLFDMREIITLPDTCFSDGSLARREYCLFTTADDFTRLRFRDIYHNSPFRLEDSPEDRDHIVNAQQAEVIYPKRISLEHLKFIFCRSQAERKTLRNLLPPAVWKQWQDKVEVHTKRTLFSKKWLYIEDVALTNKSIAVNFHLPVKQQDYGPFKIRIDLTDPRTRRSYYFQREYSNIVAELTNARLNLSFDKNISDYNVWVSIDGKLAYRRYKSVLPVHRKTSTSRRESPNNTFLKKSNFTPAHRKTSTSRRESPNNTFLKKSNFTPAHRKTSTSKRESPSNVFPKKSNFAPAHRKTSTSKRESPSNRVSYGSYQAYLTKEGEADLRRKLEKFEVQNYALTQELKNRDMDYHHVLYMQNQLSLVGGRIQHIQATLRNATIIEDEGASDEVKIGSTVTIREDGTNEDEEYKIVGSAEANPRERKISQKSPVGAALFGKKKGRNIKVETPDGTVKFKIVDVR